MNSQLNFRLTDAQKDFANRIIERLNKDKSLNKSDAFVYVFKQYEDNLISNKSGNYIAPNVRDVLEQIKCGYIGFVNDNFYCRETMAKKREPTLLAGEPEIILKNCLACIKWKLEQEFNKRNTELRKESIKKLREFMKGFIILSKSGFKYTAFMCLCDADSGNIIFSRGGEALQCPQLEKELVNIRLTCMEKINEKTGQRPCEYLASLEGIQTLDPTIFRDMDDILNNETLLPLRENELEEINRQNERLGIQVDAKVIDKEDDEKFPDETDGEYNCPDENEKNQSCINPKCEYSDKCDSYSPDEVWKMEPLK